jgi:hypothetical protein
MVSLGVRISLLAGNFGSRESALGENYPANDSQSER